MAVGTLIASRPRRADTSTRARDHARTDVAARWPEVDSVGRVPRPYNGARRIVTARTPSDRARYQEAQMNRRLALLIVVAVSLVTGCAPAAPPPDKPAGLVENVPADIAALNAARQAFMTGYEAGDADAIGKLYTADAVSESNNQASLKGRDAIVASLKRMFEQVTVKTVLTSDDTRTIGTMGVDRGHYAVTVTPKAGAAPASNEGRYMVVYLKEADGTWRVWRDMDNGLGAPKAAPDAK
jgi:uncharacterized protein (TIGR02246 family)